MNFILWCNVSAFAQTQKYSSKQQFAFLENFKLENGSTINDCKLGYRTYGKMNDSKSNVIIFPTWFTGTTEILEGTVAGQLIDTNEYFLILIDALGDGVSSSPSNSKRQPGLSFPVFSIRDMVESEYILATKHFKLQHVFAIAGISMGGMQAFQWSVSYPDFADKIIPIVGSPQLDAADMLLWNGEMQAIRRDTAYHNGKYKGNPPIPAASIMHELALTTPSALATQVTRDSFDNWLLRISGTDRFDWNNRIRQLQAMLGNDITKGGSLEETAKKIHAKMLVITSKQDHMVNPIPAAKFAGYLHANLVELESDCGHIAPGCEGEKTKAAVSSFLSGKD
ncbi:MAG: alpha/beta fold hydrolase [Bacteroidetes bacterium]|nr:alpha/beta fold hydrolase [Bacteroidota bacterium]